MYKLITGFLLGSLVTAGVTMAGTFYNDKGAPNAPVGSVQQFDYFRWRGTQLNVERLERDAEQQRLNTLTKPCAR